MFTRIEGDSAVRVHVHDHACSRQGERVERRFHIVDGVIDEPGRPVCVELQMPLGLVVETKVQRGDEVTITERVQG